MNTLIERFSNIVKGSITGFDRIVFKGIILPLMSAAEAMSFFRSNRILFKDYKKWMMEQTSRLIQSAETYARDNCGQGIFPISTWRTRKEQLAHKRQQAEGIEKGLIGVWSCLESAFSYRARYCGKTGYPQLQNYQTRCKHLYFYFDHQEYGFMNIRLQTWFPYPIQICLNGREWLRRNLQQKQISFESHGNKFLYISDYQAAQNLLNQQLDVRFVDLLNGFIPTVFPVFQDVLGPNLSYYWTMWQSEWAADLIFSSPDDLNSIKDSLLRHAHMTGTSTRVLRYMDRPLTKAGKPDARSVSEVSTRVSSFNDGIRVRHWVDHNSVKVYNEQNVLRIETTINNPKKFRVFRHKQGQNSEEPKLRLPLRKGVMDIPLRAKVSQDVNNRIMHDLSSFQDETPAGDVLKKITCCRNQKGRKFRGLDPTGKDCEMLRLICSPEFRISGLTNKSMRQSLSSSKFGSGKTDKQLSAKISRYFRLLRVHGIIRKLPRQNRYMLTTKGIQLTNILNAFLSASTKKLMKIAA
jgi:hypothetical protein